MGSPFLVIVCVALGVLIGMTSAIKKDVAEIKASTAARAQGETAALPQQGGE